MAQARFKSAFRPGRSGEAGSNPEGGAALKRSEQPGQTPPYSETSVTSGSISGISIRS